MEDKEFCFENKVLLIIENLSNIKQGKVFDISTFTKMKRKCLYFVQYEYYFAFVT